MEEKVLSILRDVLEIENISENISSESCEKWDSMAQLNISVELESEFDVLLEPEDIAALSSYKDIIRILKEKNI